MVIPFILLTLLVKKHMSKPKTRVLVELSNSLGTLYSVFFISVVISALEPFMCFKHPNDNGESVQSAPSLLCFEGTPSVQLLTYKPPSLTLLTTPSCRSALCSYHLLALPPHHLWLFSMAALPRNDLQLGLLFWSSWSFLVLFSVCVTSPPLPLLILLLLWVIKTESW